MASYATVGGGFKARGGLQLHSYIHSLKFYLIILLKLVCWCCACIFGFHLESAHQNSYNNPLSHICVVLCALAYQCVEFGFYLR